MTILYRIFLDKSKNKPVQASKNGPRSDKVTKENERDATALFSSST